MPLANQANPPAPPPGHVRVDTHDGRIWDVRPLARCTTCHGRGVVTRNGAPGACNCVLGKIKKAMDAGMGGEVRLHAGRAVLDALQVRVAAPDEPAAEAARGEEP